MRLWPRFIASFALNFALTCSAGCLGSMPTGSTSGGGAGNGTGTVEGGGNGNNSLHGNAPAGFVFSPYKDTSISLNWNTNVATTNVNGSPMPLTQDLSANGGSTITLAFATGECGSESWGGVQGAAMASANVPMLGQAHTKYILSTGGAAGTFSCGSDAGMEAFLARWDSPELTGVDFDIEAGQTPAIIADLMKRVQAAHGTHPTLRFSLTLATLANNDGAATAHSLGSMAPDSFNAMGDNVLAAAKTAFGFDGTPGTWPSYVTVNLMTMDYGAAGAGVCVVDGGQCQMGQSAIQAAYNLRDHFGVPFSGIELTPMIGGNDAQSEHFTVEDVDTMVQFAVAQGLAGVHHWSYDRDTDCPAGYASPTCNSIGGVGVHGYLKRFLAAGLQ